MSDKMKTILMFAILMVKECTELTADEFAIMSIDFDDETDKSFYYISIQFYNYIRHKKSMIRTSLLRKIIDSYK